MSVVDENLRAYLRVLSLTRGELHNKAGCPPPGKQGKSETNISFALRQFIDSQRIAIALVIDERSARSAKEHAAEQAAEAQRGIVLAVERRRQEEEKRRAAAAAATEFDDAPPSLGGRVLALVRFPGIEKTFKVRREFVIKLAKILLPPILTAWLALKGERLTEHPVSTPPPVLDRMSPEKVLQKINSHDGGL
jgi:hypothetical protein